MKCKSLSNTCGSDLLPLHTRRRSTARDGMKYWPSKYWANSPRTALFVQSWLVRILRARVCRCVPARGLRLRLQGHILAAADLGVLARSGGSRPCHRARSFFGSVRGHSPGLRRPLNLHPDGAAALLRTSWPALSGQCRLSGAGQLRRHCMSPPGASYLGALHDSGGCPGSATAF